MHYEGRILIVDDDPQYGRLLAEYLHWCGYMVLHTERGNKLIKSLKYNDLILLSATLADGAAFTQAREIRDVNERFPLMLLLPNPTGLLSEGNSAVTLFDNFIDKSLPIPAVEGLIHKNLRSRLFPFPHGAYTMTSNITFNNMRRELQFKRTGERIELTPKQTEVLSALCHYPNAITSTQEILLCIWGKASTHNKRNLDVIIAQIRKHFEGSPVFIDGVRGNGFKLRVPSTVFRASKNIINPNSNQPNDIESLREKWLQAKQTESYSVHMAFVNELLKEQSLEAIALHYEILNDSDNSSLQRVAGKAFLRRGEVAIDFIKDMLANETEDSRIANLIHILGLSGIAGNSIIIEDFVRYPAPDVRYKAIISLGWIGKPETVAKLASLFEIEKDPFNRAMIPAAFRQIYYRYKDHQNEIVDQLFKHLPKEMDRGTVAVMIVVLQDLLKKKFGLKEDSTTGRVSGDVDKAKANVMSHLSAR